MPGEDWQLMGREIKKPTLILSNLVIKINPQLIIRSVVNRDKTTWANSIMKELKARFSEHAADVLQKLISEFNSLTMIVAEKTANFLDRVKDKVNCISEIDENETPTELQIMSRVKEGLRYAHPSLHDLLELVELDYSSFMSKVEKYNKPNLLVAEKVAATVEKEIVPSANYSSDNRNKAQESGRNWKSERRSRDFEPRKCHGCGSTKHFVRDCDRKDEYYYDRQRNQQHEEASYKKSANRQDATSPKLKSILRRKSGEDGSSKAKHAKYFVNHEGEDVYSD